MRGIGNMTSVEKQMNKDDLLAYKMYDNKQYSMIPGVSKEKAFMDRMKLSSVPNPDLKDSPGKRSDMNKFH